MDTAKLQKSGWASTPNFAFIAATHSPKAKERMGFDDTPTANLKPCRPWLAGVQTPPTNSDGDNAIEA